MDPDWTLKMYFPWKQTAGTWKYPQKEKEKHLPNHQFSGSMFVLGGVFPIKNGDFSLLC